VLMGGIVVHHNMEVEFGWNIGLDMAQERQELLMTMARLALVRTEPSRRLSAANSLVVPCRL
jgi:hypothetical protein